MAVLSPAAGISTMQIGDEINLKIYPAVADARISSGRIIYIDPKKKFFRVEYTVLTNGNTIRESYSAYGKRHTASEKEKE